MKLFLESALPASSLPITHFKQPIYFYSIFCFFKIFFWSVCQTIYCTCQQPTFFSLFWANLEPFSNFLRCFIFMTSMHLSSTLLLTFAYHWCILASRRGRKCTAAAFGDLLVWCSVQISATVEMHSALCRPQFAQFVLAYIDFTESNRFVNFSRTD